MTKRGTQLVKGVLILGFRDESESEKTGLKTGDVIVQYDRVGDLTVEKVAKLAAEKRTRKSQIPVVLVRDGHTHSLTLSSQSFGLQLQEATTRISSTSKADSDVDEDELLFVLKYRGYKVCLRAVWLSAGTLAIVLAAFVSGPTETSGGLEFLLLATFQFIAFVALLLLAYALADMFLSGEVRVYNDRIVKVWYFGTPVEVEVRFTTAMYTAYILFSNHKCFVDENYASLRYFFGYVWYQESLADPNEVKKLNRLLASLSGRKLEDFERLEIIRERFIKE